MAVGAATVLISERTSERAGPRWIARVMILHDVDAAETIWRALENDDYLFTPFQKFDFLRAWQRNLGDAPGGRTPFIVVAHDRENRVSALFALETSRENGADTIRFLGGKHVTLNMGIWRREAAAAITRDDLDVLVLGIRRHAPRLDVLALRQQPRSWRGIPNPTTLLGGQSSPNACPLMTIMPGGGPETRISNSMRRRLKGKERKLERLPGYRYLVAETDSDIKTLLEAFFITKPLRMAAQKLPNVFADKRIRDFITDACMTKLADGHRAIELHGLICDQEVIAIFAGVADGARFSMMFNTYTMSDNAKYSPGLILLRDIVDHYAGLNYTSIDLGTGSDHYKRLFCKQDEPIFDSFIPLTSRGRLAAFGMSSLVHAKRLVKKKTFLRHIAQQTRAMFSR